MLQDLKYALRTMRKNPGFSVSVVLTIALGTGAATAMFSVIHAVLLKPLQYREPERVVMVTKSATPVRFEEMTVASRSYSELGAYAVVMERMALSGIGDPEVFNGARVSANFLGILGINPLVGRSFLAQEDQAGAPAVVMISAELWQRRFGGDTLIGGKTMMLAGLPHTIIGVLPPGFQFPFTGADVWLTRPSELSMIPARSRPLSPILRVFGRLKPQINLQQANAELKVLNGQYAASHPGMLDAKANASDGVRPLKDVIVSDVRPKLWMLFGAVGLVLMIVCANIGSLLLARATRRAREFAVRAALGARRTRIIGQLLAESILLATVGGVLGTLLAASGLRVIRNMAFLELPRAGEIRMDATVMGFALALAVITGILFGLAPSLASSRPDLAAVLKGTGEASSSEGPRPLLKLRLGPRDLLVVGQVAISIILLISATLLIESLARLYRVDPGFQPANLLTMSISLPPARYDTEEKRARFYEELVQRTELLPGVRNAAVTLTLPMGGFAGAPVQLAAGPPIKLNERPVAIIQDITPAYFRTLEIALKQGREFTAHDNADSVRVAIINETLARIFWPDYPQRADVIGQHLLIGANPQPIEIAGIAADVRQTGKEDDPRPGVYLPCAQNPPPSAMLAVRTSGDPLNFAPAVRNQVLAIDRDQPVSAIASMDQLVEASEGQLRFLMRLLGIFAGAATLLAVLGLYAVISYSVLQRTREIGIRRALGAQQADILSLVLGQGFGLSLSGVLLGICGALALTRVLKAWLFKVSATDPVTFFGVAVLFVLVALAASYIPARRATKIDPLVALKLL